MCSIKPALALLMTLLLTACGGMADDLRPSGADKQIATGGGGTTTVANLTLPAIDGTSVDLATLLTTHDAVVFYFTMWCPVCDSHMSHIRSAQEPRFPNVAFVMVDYVSSSVEEARLAAGGAGYAGGTLIVVADTAGAALAEFQGTMGTTVVVGPGMTLLMNEDYKDGVKLTETLAGI